MDVQTSPAVHSLQQWEPGGADTARSLAQAALPESPQDMPQWRGAQQVNLSLHPSVAMQLKASGTAPAGTAPAPATELEVAALQLILAQPEIQALIQEFGGDGATLGGNAVADSIVQRYGPELASQLQQLYTAQQNVQAEYLRALDAAMGAEPGPGVMGSRLHPGAGHADGDPPHWEFDAQQFTRDWAAGDSPAQRAFAALYGADAMSSVTYRGPGDEEGERLIFAGQRFTAGGPISADEGMGLWAQHLGRHPSTLQAGLERLDPNDPPELLNNDAVWFDPQRGWMTDPNNVVIEQDWLDRAFPAIVGLAIGWMAGPILSGLPGSLGTSAVAGAAESAIASLIQGAVVQLTTTGEVDFGGLVRSALTDAVTGALQGAGGFGGLIQEGGALAGLLGDGNQLLEMLRSALGGGDDFGSQLLGAIAAAGGQAAVDAIKGGDFGDAFVQGLLNQVASQVSSQLISQIDNNPRLSTAEQSVLRLVASATDSALRSLGNGKEDPADAFARTFLAALLKPADAAATPSQKP